MTSKHTTAPSPPQSQRSISPTHQTSSPRPGGRRSAHSSPAPSPTHRAAPSSAAAAAEPPSPDADKQQKPRAGRHHSLAGVAHAVQFTQSWKPARPRANSWTPEDKKRAVQMMGLFEGQSEIPDNYCQFSEKDLEQARVGR